jgi:hypothetical protein
MAASPKVTGELTARPTLSFGKVEFSCPSGTREHLVVDAFEQRRADSEVELGGRALRRRSTETLAQLRVSEKLVECISEGADVPFGDEDTMPAGFDHGRNARVPGAEHR